MSERYTFYNTQPRPVAKNGVTLIKKYSVWYICTLENYKVTYLLKVFARYRRIRKQTQFGRHWEHERAQCIVP